MEDREINTKGQRPEKPARTGPIPLADRRRLVRPPEKSETSVKVFTDWASI